MTVHATKFKTSGDFGNHLAWMDYLRFFAAFSVLLFHYCFDGIRHGKIKNINSFDLLGDIAQYGYLGVDIFFIISGFVILFSIENKSADKFANARLVRLYPAFIACMTITAIASAMWGSGVSLSQYLANLSMVASYLGYKNIDGVYWTLSLELAFYAVVLLMLLFGLEKRLEEMVAAWIILMLIFRVFSINIPLFGGYFSLFASGSLFAFIYKEGYTWKRIALLAIVFLLSLDGALERAALIDERNLNTSNNYIVAGITTLFFTLFVLFRNLNFKLPASRMIGSLTYPIYLLHATIGYLLLSSFGSNENRWMALIVTIVIVISSSWLITHFVEHLPNRYWHRLADQSIGSAIRFIVRARNKFAKASSN